MQTTQYVVWVRWAGRSIRRPLVVQATDTHEAEDRALAYLSEQHGHHIGYSNVEMNVETHGDWIPDGAVIVPEPEPEPEPPTRRQRQPRQSREAQYNQRVQAAFNTLRETANRDGQATHRAFSVASQSQPGAHHTVTWDTASDHTHCDCTAGQYGRDCVHQAAMRRYIAAIHAADARRTDEAAQARQAEAARARQIRRQIVDVLENIGDMQATYVRIGERSGWDDALLGALDQEIEYWRGRVAALRRELRDLAQDARMAQAPAESEWDEPHPAA